MLNLGLNAGKGDVTLMEFSITCFFSILEIVLTVFILLVMKQHLVLEYQVVLKE